MRLSVLIPVYGKASPLLFEQALASIKQQTVAATEVLIVQDGPIPPEMERVIDAFMGDCGEQKAGRPSVRILSLPQPVGLGQALAAGVTACRSELIARMDADDLSVPERFALQLAAFSADPSLDALGGAISEFAGRPQPGDRVRRLPFTEEAIRRFAKSRNPLNHMTVMFRRDAVLRAGNYQPFPEFEDYHLWVRMLEKGCHLANLPAVLVQARAGDAMLGRRGGLRYALRELSFQNFLRSSRFISPAHAVRNVLLRVPVRLAPPALLKWVYRTFLRSPHPRPASLEVCSGEAYPGEVCS